MNGETIRGAVDQLVARHTDPKRKITVSHISASSLWLELGLTATSWRTLDAALAAVDNNGLLGRDYTPQWLKEHAGEIAALL